MRARYFIAAAPPAAALLLSISPIAAFHFSLPLVFRRHAGFSLMIRCCHADIIDYAEIYGQAAAIIFAIKYAAAITP